MLHSNSLAFVKDENLCNKPNYYICKIAYDSTPYYPYWYLVRSEVIDEAESRGAEFDGVIGKIDTVKLGHHHFGIRADEIVLAIFYAIAVNAAICHDYKRRHSSLLSFLVDIRSSRCSQQILSCLKRGSLQGQIFPIALFSYNHTT